MDNQPDLPGLESIDEKDGSGAPCCFCLIIPLVLIGGVSAGYWLCGVIASIALTGLAFLAARLCDYSIRTDSNGLSLIRPLLGKRIAWADVTGAATVDEPEGERAIVIESRGRSIRVPATGVAMARLEASVWQHLRRAGKAGDITLSEEALSFWQPIPEDIPEEMDWEMQRELEWAKRARYSLRRGYILCDLLHSQTGGEAPEKPRVIDFPAVTSVQWETYDDNDEHADLSIESKDESIYIPLDSEDPASARFLLGTIRRLRETTRVKPVAIIKPLRKLLSSDAGPHDSSLPRFSD